MSEFATESNAATTTATRDSPQRVRETRSVFLSPYSYESYALFTRWTHYIDYKCLVMSSVISAVNIFRYPCLFGPEIHVPIVVLSLLMTLIFAYPMQYLELAIGMVTQKSVVKSWDFAPIGRGIGFSMILVCMSLTLTVSMVAAYCLAFFVHSFHMFIPWLNCPTISPYPCAHRYQSDAEGRDPPSEAFLFNHILDLKRTGIGTGLGRIVWELCMYYLITWILIGLISFRGIYSYSKMVIFSAIVCLITLGSSLTAVIMLDSELYIVLFDVIRMSKFRTYYDLVEHSLTEVGIGHGVNIMLGSLTREKKLLHKSCLLSLLVAKVVSLTSAFIVGKAVGTLKNDYNVIVNYRLAGPSMPFVMWSDLVVRIPGNQFWSAFTFFGLYVVSITSAALLIQTILSNVTGELEHSIRTLLSVGLCLFFFLVGSLTMCTQGGIFIITFIDYWMSSSPRLPIAAATASVVTLAYGRQALADEICYCVEEKTNIYLKWMWLFLPFLLNFVFIAGVALNTFPRVTARVMPLDVLVAGQVIVFVIVAPIIITMVFYFIFMYRTSKLIGKGK